MTRAKCKNTAGVGVYPRDVEKVAQALVKAGLVLEMEENPIAELFVDENYN